MATYLLSQTLIHASALISQIKAMSQTFHWQKRQAATGIHYVPHENVCQPLAAGGLGFHSSSQ